MRVGLACNFINPPANTDGLHRHSFCPAVLKSRGRQVESVCDTRVAAQGTDRALTSGRSPVHKRSIPPFPLPALLHSLPSSVLAWPYFPPTAENVLCSIVPPRGSSFRFAPYHINLTVTIPQALHRPEPFKIPTGHLPPADMRLRTPAETPPRPLSLRCCCPAKARRCASSCTPRRGA